MVVNKLKGPLGAALTPLRDDGAIDFSGFARHCLWLLNSGCRGVAVFGTTGEAECFTNDERMAALDHLIENGVDPRSIIVGTGRAAVGDSIILTRHAVAHGCAGVLALPPFYYKGVREDGLFRAFSEIIQGAGADQFHLYLYHFPDMSGVAIEHSLVRRLRKEFPRHIAGLKDSSGDLDGTIAFAKIGDGFDVFSGDDHLLGPMLDHGGVGSITSTSNIAPHLLAAVYEGWAKKNDKAMAAHRLLEEIWVNGLLKYPVTEALKGYLAEKTGSRQWLNMRAPLARLTAEEYQALTSTIDRAGFSILESQKETLEIEQ